MGRPLPQAQTSEEPRAPARASASADERSAVNVMVFFGREGWRASSLDPSGDNLPPAHGPWTAFRMTVATDPGELAALREQSFFLERRREDDDT